MSALVWLDVPLLALGLLAISPWVWHWIRRWRSVRTPSLSRGLRTATTLLCYLGFGSLTMAGIDVALAEWDKAHRPSGDDGIEETRIASPPRSDDRIKVTMMAPDFRLPSLDEDRFVRLSDYRGHKPVVLIFSSFG